jgi:DNA-binding transcriptional LysR family regulator
MTFKQLQFFRKTAELENISKAAKELFVAQPALSKSIKDLEEELKFPLFDRNGKKISLNQNGRILYKHVQLVQNNLLQLEQELLEANTQTSHSAAISIRVASKLLPDILRTFYAKYPDYNLKVYQLGHNPSSLPPFDVIIDSAPGSTSLSLNSIKLLEERILLALPPSHPLADKEHIRLSDLAVYPCSLLNESCSLGKLLHTKMNALHFMPNIIFESDNPHMIRDFLALHLTYSFVPEKTWNIKKDFPQLLLREVTDFACSREIYLTYLQKEYAVLAAREFTTHVKEYFQKL